jgi:hypothetical protein
MRSLNIVKPQQLKQAFIDRTKAVIPADAMHAVDPTRQAGHAAGCQTNSDNTRFLKASRSKKPDIQA